MTKILAVPTNILTGFLGAGKTTAILQLLEQKPADERWAVLVNEFGEIGVDGSLFEGQHGEESGVFIREVPGGCMCCAAGLPMQIALNMLLSRAKPDRLLIEPTGLGHPLEVVQSLSAEHYRDVLSLQQIITLVDARQLDDSRYTDHPTFNQQIAIADLIVGNKQDLYQTGDHAKLEAYVAKQAKPDVPVLFTEQGELAPELLNGASRAAMPETDGYGHHHHSSAPGLSEAPIPDSGFLKAENQGEGFESIGWRFNADEIFDRAKLMNFLSGLDAERMKAVFITEEGIFGYNLTRDALTEIELDDSLESRIEIIAPARDSSWETELMACRVNPTS
ncbi:CobW family GTP-binding protein [Motiliproteus coralliicola]|uniref:CobW family GTP-binding protein n=1 Tax=Motiliproteus coralliicola TaxID=2283196 RepID=UPI001FB4CC9A|nr:GTP-binding protein [Motiliproteus coralliicola]